MPLAVVCGLTIVYAIRVLINKCYYKMEPREAKDKTFKSTIVGVGCTFLYYAHLPITKSGMEFFDCSTTATGIRIMDAAPEIPCEGGKYNRLSRLAITSLLVYRLGIPLFFAQTIWRHKSDIQEEQSKREQDFINDIEKTTIRMRYR